jgi:hypothetical protein
MLIEPHVADCWRFEYNNGYGYFGGQDIDPWVPSARVTDLLVLCIT